MKTPICEKVFKPGQLFTLKGKVYQVRKSQNGDDCEKCEAYFLTETRIGSELKRWRTCETGIPPCDGIYFKRIK